MPTISLLSDTHVLILMGDQRTRDKLNRLFENMGATVHAACNQNAAIGVYWQLYRKGIRPRVVVTSWWLTQPGTKEYQYLEMLGRAEVDGTALNLLINIIDLDPKAFLTVYTQDPGSANEIIGKSGIQAEVFSRHEIELSAFVARVATHPGVATQRGNTEVIHRELNERESRYHAAYGPSGEWQASAFG